MTRQGGSYAVFRMLQAGSVLVPLLGLVLWGLQAWDYRREQGIDTARANVEIAREYVLRFIQTQEALLGEADAIVRGMAWDKIAGSQRIQRALERLNRSGATTGIAIADGSGVFRVSDRASELAVDVSDRDYFRTLREGKQRLAIGGRITGRLSGEETFSIARRRSGDAFDGIVASSVRVDTLVGFFARLRGEERRVVALVRADGELLARDPHLPPRRYSSATPFMRAAAGAPFGWYEAVGEADGVPRFYAYGQVGDLPLYVTFGVAREAVIERWTQDMYWAALFALAVMLLGATAATQALRRARADAAYRQRLGADVAARTTELEKALEEKDVLLREVHHRVKNNLQMIASMVGIVARRDPGNSRAAFDEIRRRIVTVGQAYNAVYQAADLRSIDLAAYVGSVADQIVAGSGRRDIVVRTALQTMPVDIDTALPVGLVAHELVVNALKHAFPPGRSGEIVVELEAEGEEAVLTVRDNGVGLPAAGRGEGTGLRLVNALAPQVDGRIAMEPGEGGGARFRLVFRRERRRRNGRTE